MFVIKSKDLKTNVNVGNEDIVGDPASLKIEDETKFFYKSKIYSGRVIKISDPKLKRKRDKKRSYSPSDYDKKSNKSKENDKQAKKSKKLKKDESSSSSENSEDDSKSKKDEVSDISSLEDSTENLEKPKSTGKVDKHFSRRDDSSDYSALNKKNSLPKEGKNTSSKTHSSSASGNSTLERTKNDELDNHGRESGVQQSSLDNDDHLLGVASADMVLLKNNIYVKKTVLDTAKRTSSQASHLARQLLEGVIKAEILQRSTLTGKAMRGKKDPNVLPLHAGAKDAIVAYAQEIAREKHWTAQDVKTIEKSIGQKLTEIRNAHKKNLEIRQA
ncbi:uncharacterized protein LOC123265783 [Cotesia glomerata]|uniref:BEN domain-containing protein n=1 Tax=Cotesia glomerata TaxID=32391 RepID=A0AAV7IZ81_COTGL|nr:uncharacterized protein LOC123265783 [Cotesia glomerata]KAH0561204.1 hypothetical protein KQX54_014553 [Cotesia glomerata]